MKRADLILAKRLRRVAPPSLGDSVEINGDWCPGGWSHKGFAIMVAGCHSGADYLKPISSSVTLYVKGHTDVIGEVGGTGA